MDILHHPQNNSNSRLQNFIEDAIIRAAGTPMIWGTDDCCLFVADIIAEGTGIDPAEPWRGKYTSEDEAAVVMPGGIVKTVDRRCRELGWSKVPPEKADIGDIGISRNDGKPAVVIRYGEWWVGRCDGGVTYTPPDLVFLAWSVPWRR